MGIADSPPVLARVDGLKSSVVSLENPARESKIRLSSELRSRKPALIA